MPKPIYQLIENTHQIGFVPSFSCTAWMNISQRVRNRIGGFCGFGGKRSLTGCPLGPALIGMPSVCRWLLSRDRGTLWVRTRRRELVSPKAVKHPLGNLRAVVL